MNGKFKHDFISNKMADIGLQTGNLNFKLRDLVFQGVLDCVYRGDWAANMGANV